MKTLIHIGAPKTATTFLQEVYYPHHPELAYLPHVNEWNRWLFCLNKTNARAIATCEEGIIGQPQWRKSILNNLFEFVKDPIILITTRAPSAGLLASIYSQAIRGGDRRSFNDFFKQEVDTWVTNFNFDNHYQECCSIFGAERVRMLPFELLRDNQELFLRELEKIAGISEFNPAQKKPVNQKMSEAQMLCYRKLAPIISRIASLRGNPELPLYAKKIYLTHSRKMGLVADKVGSILQLIFGRDAHDTKQVLDRFSCYSPAMKNDLHYSEYINSYKNP